MSLVLPEGVRERTPHDWQVVLAEFALAQGGRMHDLQYARRVTRLTARMMRAYRRKDEAEFMACLREFGPCLLIAAWHAKVSMSDALALKYPDRCYYCHETQRCRCTPKEKAERPHLDGQPKPRIAAKPLNGWQDKLWLLYGQVNAERGLDDTVSHLHEEAVEITAEVCDPDPDNHVAHFALRNEFADAFAWWIAVLNHYSLRAAEVLYEYAGR